MCLYFSRVTLEFAAYILSMVEDNVYNWRCICGEFVSLKNYHLNLAVLYSQELRAKKERINTVNLKICWLNFDTSASVKQDQTLRVIASTLANNIFI